ncbi:ATP-binding protein [Chitinophaga sancti]|uniref:ATP-binding protein n=1 Tax=Chitinophaga sancti TaxID=1004 RepID=UPI002A753AC7|nr:ATP-binding protein [Chitinophaga sancti]WPQ64810.1 ATP-binding protein [Chitinophaga sancti]
MVNISTEWLQSVEAFKDVPVEQLKWLAENSESKTLLPGDFMFKTGAPLDATYILISGKLRLYYLQNNDPVEITVMEAGTISGYLPFSRGMTATIYSEAVEESQLMCFPIEKIDAMIHTQFELTQALVHVMTNRVREYTTMMRQNEKMMALGKLSAGLAHELNNPAAAIVRGASSLRKHLQLMPDTFQEIMAIQMTPEDVTFVKEKMFAILKSTDRPKLTMMERGAKEDDMVDWLDDHDVANGVEIAENFVEFGITIDILEEFKSHMSPGSLSAVLNWIDKNLVTERMVLDIEEASARIVKLVSSVKTFTHMDQSHDKRLTDIHDGIRNTLNIMEYKLRKGHVHLIENYDTSLPPVSIMIGEMNQVWTNLIDNAVDAMQGRENSTLEIKTEKDGTCVKVSIIDNGPGIPENIQSRIFDPFFTTKEIGKGTGLGLDISCQIVKQHHGNIKVNSVPGKTLFSVLIPIH